MDLPANSSVWIVRDEPSGDEDGTPTFRTVRHGPYRAWYRERQPDEQDQPAEVLRIATVYYQPGVRPDQADRIDVKLDNDNTTRGFEVVSVRDRTDHQGLHHYQVLIRRVVEGR